MLLEGELGSGKTTLAKGIVAGLGAAREEEVTSPSFTFVHEYGRKNKVYHVDLYRIENPPELRTLGLEDLLGEQTVMIVEWGEKLQNSGGSQRLNVQLQHLANEGRRITVERIIAG